MRRLITGVKVMAGLRCRKQRLGWGDVMTKMKMAFFVVVFMSGSLNSSNRAHVVRVTVRVSKEF